MRKEFSNWIEQYGREESRFIFLTGDLGYNALENVQATLGERFINMGVCEQNMVSVAAGLAQQGLAPLCYSIAPFMVFRPYEQIRLDVALHRLNVKVVGNGGGYGYGIMGASHHAIEDIAVLSSLPGFACFVPLCNSDVDGACQALFGYQGPSYLRLGFGLWPSGVGELPPFKPVRKLSSGRPAKLTVVGLGPVLLNTLPWIRESEEVDLFVVGQLPWPSMDEELLASVRATNQLLVIEEHVARGGLGEYLSAQLAQQGVPFRLTRAYARGYPDGLIGSQSYHQSRSGLDADSLRVVVKNLQSGKQPCLTN
jgi:transketolase